MCKDKAHRMVSVDPVTDPPYGAPDAHWAATDEEGEVRARCSLWWRDVPDLPGERPGLIGQYEAESFEAGGELLDHACDELAARGCTTAVGPVNGDIWRGYRFVVDRGEEPPFALEPDNPDMWVKQFREAGFDELASYHSAAVRDLEPPIPRLDRLSARLAARGIRLRHADVSRWEEELRRLHPLIMEAFKEHLLFSPIGADELVRLYAPVQPMLRPEFVTIAEAGDRPVGFLFGLPDRLQAEWGGMDTAILHVAAVAPEYERTGLGMYMGQRAQEEARRQGFGGLIYALMRDGDASARLSNRYRELTVIRSYAVFARYLR